MASGDQSLSLWLDGTQEDKIRRGDLCSRRLSPQPRSELLLTTLPGTPHWVREATEPGLTAVLWAPRAWPSLPGPGSPWAVPAGKSTHSTWLNPHKAERRTPTGHRRGLLQGRQVTGSGSQLPPEVTPVRAPTPPGALSSSERERRTLSQIAINGNTHTRKCWREGLRGEAFPQAMES